MNLKILEKTLTKTVALNYDAPYLKRGFEVYPVQGKPLVYPTECRVRDLNNTIQAQKTRRNHWIQVRNMRNSWISLIAVLGMSGASADVIHEFKELPKVQRKQLKKSTGSQNLKLLFYKGLIAAKDTLDIRLNASGLPVLNGRFGPQFITPASALDLDLLSRSQISSRPIEVMTVSAKWKEEEYHFNRFYSSKAIDHIDISEANQAISDFLELYAAKTGGKELDYIQITHSHPIYEALDLKGNRIHWRYLSEGDMANGALWSKLLGVPVIIAAAMANEYTYSSIFIDGRNRTQ